MLSRPVLFILVAALPLFTIAQQSAYAYTFNDYESASFLAKLIEVKVETGLIASHAGDKDAINYYQGMLKTYWTPNETSSLEERNPQLASTIVSDINSTIADARAGNSDKAGSDYFDIAVALEQAGVVRVDPPSLNNQTVQAMSIAMVLKESLGRYGDAVGSPGLGTTSQNPSGGQSGPITTSGTSNIVNQYAYENSKGLADEAQQMFGQLISHHDNKPYSDRIGTYITKYGTDLGNKADTRTVMADVYDGIFPNFVSGYSLDLESIPEFSSPSVVVFATVASTIVLSRLYGKKTKSKRF